MLNDELSLNKSEIMEMFHELGQKNPCNICETPDKIESVCEVCENTPLYNVQKGYLPVSNMLSNIMRNIYREIPFENCKPYIKQFSNVLNAMKMELIEKPFHKVIVGYLQPFSLSGQLEDIFRVYSESYGGIGSNGSLMRKMKEFIKEMNSEHNCEECEVDNCENREETA